MKTAVRWPLAIMLLSAASFFGCSSQTLVKKTPTPGPQAAQPSQEQKTAVMTEGLQPVYFDFDSAALKSEALDVLRANATWLKGHRRAKVKIEGRCDERGTQEYNLALGQRRAMAVERYYVNSGVKRARVSAISYGKDKPLCTESTESCWAQNRQADGLVTPKNVASK